MARRARQVQTGWALDYPNVGGAIRGLNRYSKAAGGKAKQIIREGTNDILRSGRIAAQGRPGGGTYPRRNNAYGTSITNKGAAIRIRGKAVPWAVAQELGTKADWVFGRPYLRNELSRPHFAPYHGFPTEITRGRGGHAMLPVMRAKVPTLEEEILDDLIHLLSVILGEEGVPKSGTAVGGSNAAGSQ